MASRGGVVALTLGLLCPIEARAEQLSAIKSRFVMASWTEQDGLPSNQVEALAQTPDGYLWVGTQGGLVRFDGVRFTRFAALNSSSLPAQGVSALHTSRDGSLWVGFAGSGGVSRINGAGVTNFTVADGLTRGRLHAIVDTADGTIWAGGVSGLFRFRHARWQPVDARDGFSGRTVISLYEDSRGNLWVGADTGVFVRRASTWQFERRSALLTRANGISEDPSGSIWVSTPTGFFAKSAGRTAYGLSGPRPVTTTSASGTIGAATCGWRRWAVVCFTSPPSRPGRASRLRASPCRADWQAI